MFNSFDNSPVYQLKKHYPEIHNEFICREVDECNAVFRQNITKGIKEGLYRENIDIESSVRFYYTLIFNINETTKSEKEAAALCRRIEPGQFAFSFTSDCIDQFQ